MAIGIFPNNPAQQGAQEGYNNSVLPSNRLTEMQNSLQQQNGNQVPYAPNNQNTKHNDDNYSDFDRRPRKAWSMYTLASKKKAIDAGTSIYNFDECINFYCNPSQYTFDFPYRQTVAKAKGGMVVHTFRDIHRSNTNLDFGTIQITFESGSILPRMYKDSPSERGFPEGLGNYYKYLDIVQQDKVYRNSENVIESNYVVIEMNTLAFPKLVLYVYPIDKVGNGENVDNVGELTEWTGNFQIFKTEPSIFSGNGDIFTTFRNSYRQNIQKRD